MLRNYFVVAIRNLVRNKITSLIHVIGFGLGIAAFLFAAQTVITEYSYVYRIKFQVWMFLIPCVSLLLIALITVGYQTIRAANTIPVDSLRRE